MNTLDTNGMLAQQIMRERAELGRRSRVAALAPCCRPSTWRRAAWSTVSPEHGHRRAR